MAEEEGAPSPGFPAPVTFGPLARISWQLYATRFRTFFGPALGIYLVLSYARVTLAADMPNALAIALFLLLEIIVPVAVSSYLFGALSLVYADALVGTATSLRNATRSLAAQRRDLVSMGMFAGLITFGMLLGLGQIAALFYAMFIGPPVFIHVIGIERKPLQSVSPRARELLAGHWSRILFYLLTLALFAGVLAAGILSALFQSAEGGSEDLAAGLLFLGTEAVLDALTLPYIAAAGLVAYLDLRARKEDLDLERLRAELTRD